MTLHRIIHEHYRPDIQMSVGQVMAIGSAMRAAAPNANVLVFGCGNDSDLWYRINHDGFTLFLEDYAVWIDKIRSRAPHLNIEEVSYGDRTVEGSVPIDEDALAQYPIPACMLERSWDVIVIDAPRGHKPWLPGRSLPIYWSSRVAQPETHVFVDDCSRRLEKAYADHFLRPMRPWSIVIPRIIQSGKPSKGSLLWAIGAGSDYQAAALIVEAEQSNET
jgi:hypothetical protein